MPISPDMFRLQQGDTTLSRPLAIERLSQIANMVMVVSGDSVQHTDRSLDAQLELLVQQSMPASPDATTSLGASKSPASQAFDSMALGSLEGPFQFHPAYAIPADWYDPGAATNWTAHTIGQATAASGTTQPPPRARPVILQPPVWRVLPAQAAPALAQPISVAHPMVVAASPARVAPAVAIARPIAMPPAAAGSAPVARSVFVPSPTNVARPAPVATSARVLNIAMVSRTNTAIAATATAQPMTGDSVSISFEHCIVTFNRPWYPQGFLMLRDWYLPDYKKGDFSQGTGAKDTSLLPLVTTGFVAIRNLSIRANWSAQDRAAAQQSAAFGPFSLVGRNFDTASGTLNAPGIQIIGWFLAPLPVLPPNTDPALLPPPPPPPPPSALDLLRTRR